MADGLDQVAQAFQIELTPDAPRPRSDDGRFAAGKPEPLFAERPIEGDPLTGDNRDGGEDSRLAKRERDIADGRLDERQTDEGRGPQSRRPAAQGDKSVPDGEKGAGPAGVDEEHEGAASEQEEHGGDQPEHEAGAESQFKVTTLDGQPVEKFEVTVDGSPIEVSLDEALSGYIKDRTFHQRMNKVDIARQQVEAQANEVNQWRDHYTAKLQMLDRDLAELTPQEPDWDKEFAANPHAARERQKAYQMIYGRRQHIAAEMARTQAEARQIYDRNAERYAVEQFSQFVQESKIPDDATLQKRMSRMRSYGQKMGFSEGELATIYDKRMLRVLDQAAQNDQAVTATPKAVIPGRGKTLTPGVATPIGNATRRHIDEAQNRLQRTGKLEDAEAVFSRIIR